MPWVETRKTKYGFEYLVGSIPIARAKWVRRGGDWQVALSVLEPSDTAPMHTSFDTEVMPLKDVTHYLHEKLKRTEPDQPGDEDADD